MGRRSPRSNDDERRHLLMSWIRAGTTPQRVVRRARIVLLVLDGYSVRSIARTLRVSTRTVVVWGQRFGTHGPEALLSDAPGRGRKPTVAVSVRARLAALMNTPPPRGQRWTIRSLAGALSASRASVHRALKAEIAGRR